MRLETFIRKSLGMKAHTVVKAEALPDGGLVARVDRLPGRRLFYAKRCRVQVPSLFLEDACDRMLAYHGRWQYWLIGQACLKTDTNGLGLLRDRHGR